MLCLVLRNLRNFRGTQDGIVGFRVDRRGTVSLSLCAMVFSGPRRKEKGIQSCASNVVIKLCDTGAGEHAKYIQIMKENGIMVDYEWAYKEVMLSHDFSGKSPAWVNSFVEGWREGYLGGFLKGWTEGTIEVLHSMKCSGMSCEEIARITGISSNVVEMISSCNGRTSEE